MPKMKFSENVEKNTLPGKKELYRYFDENGYFYRDAVVLGDEKTEEISNIYHPVYPEKNTSVKKLQRESILHQVVNQGEIIFQKETLSEIHEYVVKRAALLPDEHKRFISPHIYKVGISEKLMNNRNVLTKKLKNQFRKDLT